MDVHGWGTGWGILHRWAIDDFFLRLVCLFFGKQRCFWGGFEVVCHRTGRVATARHQRLHTLLDQDGGIFGLGGVADTTVRWVGRVSADLSCLFWGEPRVAFSGPHVFHIASAGESGTGGMRVIMVCEWVVNGCPWLMLSNGLNMFQHCFSHRITWSVYSCRIWFILQ